MKQYRFVLITLFLLFIGGFLWFRIRSSEAKPVEKTVHQVSSSESVTQQEAEQGTTDFEMIKAPHNLSEELRKGGYVFVFRYTGAGGKQSPIPAELKGQVRDDGQRISPLSKEMMQAYGQKYQELGIHLDHIITSEYYFVWQHAKAAFSQELEISRDLTGSLDFNDKDELQESLQNLRNRTIMSPKGGQSTLLFTHQGKFDKAFGYYPPAGTTIIFRPDGTTRPRLVAVLSFEEFLSL